MNKFDPELAREGRESEFPQTAPKKRRPRFYENPADPSGIGYIPADATELSRYSANNNRNFGTGFGLVFEFVNK
jgi:hypothetical protein